MQTIEQRNADICHDYNTMEVAELARTYGLSSKRIKQILDEKEISRRPRLAGEKRIISMAHSVVGLNLYSFREAKGTAPLVANEWTGR